MTSKKDLLKEYISYNPEEDYNGSQGHAIIDRIISKFGSFEEFTKYKNSYGKNPFDELHSKIVQSEGDLEKKLNLDNLVFKNEGNFTHEEYKTLDKALSENYLKTLYGQKNFDYVEDIKNSLKEIEKTGLVALPKDYADFGVKDVMSLYSFIKNKVRFGLRNTKK